MSLETKELFISVTMATSRSRDSDSETSQLGKRPRIEEHDSEPEEEPTEILGSDQEVSSEAPRAPAYIPPSFLAGDPYGRGPRMINRPRKRVGLPRKVTFRVDQAGPSRPPPVDSSDSSDSGDTLPAATGKPADTPTSGAPQTDSEVPTQQTTDAAMSVTPRVEYLETITSRVEYRVTQHGSFMRTLAGHMRTVDGVVGATIARTEAYAAATYALMGMTLFNAVLTLWMIGRRG
jgi:hypothetical protein